MPVEGDASALRVRVEEAVPPAGRITWLGRLTVIPCGAAPDQAVERLTGELNPLTEETVTVEDADKLGESFMMAGVGCMSNSGFVDIAMLVPVGETMSWRLAKCVMPPLDAVTMNGYVPVVTVPAT